MAQGLSFDRVAQLRLVWLMQIWGNEPKKPTLDLAKDQVSLDLLIKYGTLDELRKDAEALKKSGGNIFTYDGLKIGHDVLYAAADHLINQGGRR